MRLNGNLVFNTGGGAASGEIQNAYIERLATAPAFAANENGRIYYNTADQLYYYNNGSAWVALSTGGNTAALQAEVDAIETSLGAGINSDGTFNATGLTGTYITGPTSFTDAILQLDSALNANNTLAELDDVNVTPTDKQFLQYDSGTSKWVNHTLVLADVTDVTVPAAELNLLNGLTASAAELNILDGATLSTTELNVLDGITATTTELNYTSGVTSPIQTQLDGKQPLDATLTALAGISGTGIVVETGVDTFTHRTLVAPAEGITITNPDGVAGDITFALANDLAALEGLTGNGYIVRTGDGTAATRTIQGASGQIVVTNGDGVASNTDIGLATITQGTGGTFVKVTLDAYGRVVENTAVAASDITGLVDSVYVNVAGDSMTGILDMGNNRITNMGDPLSSGDAATKSYVDTVAQGLATKPAVEVIVTSTTQLGAFTYDNGTNGVGATITANSNGAFPSIDGFTVASTTVGQNGVLVAFPNNTADAIYNGRYNLTQVGDGSTPWVLTRCGLCDSGDEIPGSFTFVKEGTQYQGTGWVQVRGTDVDAELDLDVGTDQIWVYQFSSAGTVQAGIGLSSSGTVLNVNLGAGIAELPGDEVGIDLYTPTAGALILTTDGTTRTTTSPAGLHLLLPSNSGLTQDATGLYIGTNAITNAMILNDSHVLNADTGSGTLALGDTLLINGTATQGINTSVTGQTFTITAADASASQKGVATFDATEFTVTAGNVVLGTVPVTKLSDNTINFVGTDASSDTVTLGESFTFVDGASDAQLPLVKVAIATNQATITLRQATTGDLGVASFNAAHFSVTNGAVSLDATLDDLANVSNADTAGTGDILRKTAGDWEAVSTAALAADIDLADLGDVDNAAVPTDGHALIGDGTSWVNQKVYHLHDQTTAATSWTVTHGLGQQYCVVTVVDSTDNVIIPNSIVFDTANQLTVTFTSSISGKVVIMGVA